MTARTRSHSRLAVLAGALVAAIGFNAPAAETRGAPAPRLDIRFHPADLYAGEVDRDRGLRDLLIHRAALINAGETPVRVQAIRLDLLHAGEVRRSIFIRQDELEVDAAKLAAYAGAGMLELYDMHFQTSRLIGDAPLSPTTTLEPGSSLMLTSLPLLLEGEADRVRLTAFGEDANGRSVEAVGFLDIVEYRSPNAHGFPLKGTWFVAAGADMHDHHRWGSMEEFALDLVVMGEGGTIHGGDVRDVKSHHCYGQEVLATADGTVVEVEGGRSEAVERLPREGESAKEFAARSRAEQDKLIRENYKSVLGNYVTLEHAGGEYTHYVHLMEKSVTLKPGDRVRKGQPIGRVGHTGNSEAPHLHFQVTDGQDPMYSRGLPVVFDNVVVEIFGYTDRPLHSGWIVTTQE